MQYMGGKARIAKHLTKYINEQLNEGDVFIDLFCGSCNVVSNIRVDVQRYANDLNQYLPCLFAMLQSGWKPPTSVSEEEYAYWKSKTPRTMEEYAIKCFIGYGCSFAGKWWGGYASTGERNYALNAYNSLMKKMKTLNGVKFSVSCYSEFLLPKGSVVYCDIPYKDTTSYSAVGKFDHNKFYEWLKQQTHCTVYVSEYAHNVPEWGEVVWQMESKQSLRNKNNELQPTVEVLWRSRT